MSNDYLGALTPPDTKGWFNVISFIARQINGQQWTGTMVKVVAVHGGGIAAPPTVDVQPLVNQIDGAGNATPHGTIYNLPVLRAQGGLAAIIIDPVVGDIGWAAFADHDISSAKATKAQANPGSRRRFDPADGVYVATVLGAQPTTYIMVAAGNVSIATPGNVSVAAANVAITSGNVSLGATGGPAVARVGDPVVGGFIADGSTMVTCA